MRIPLDSDLWCRQNQQETDLFDEQYQPVYEESIQLAEAKDEDGFSCEDVDVLTTWVKNSFANNDPRFEIKQLIFSGYGASFVYSMKIKMSSLHYIITWNLFPPALQKKFYSDYGGESQFSKITASPVLGNLNSGMQLYRVKHEKPELFKHIKYALHLPQYLSFILCSSLQSDIQA